jgi:hypothetical protein
MTRNPTFLIGYFQRNLLADWSTEASSNVLSARCSHLLDTFAAVSYAKLAQNRISMISHVVRCQQLSYLSGTLQWLVYLARKVSKTALSA